MRPILGYIRLFCDLLDCYANGDDKTSITDEMDTYWDKLTDEEHRVIAEISNTLQDHLEIAEGIKKESTK